jgi:proline dehydrogenase
MKERLPRLGFIRRAVRRFMPGEEADDALREAERLRKDGAATILTLLGENVDTEAEARAVVDHYLEVLAAVRRAGLDAEVSVKLTQLGLDLSPELALEHVRTLVKASATPAVAAETPSTTSVAATDVATRPGGGPSPHAPPLRLWIDMESSAYVDRTLDLYRTVRREHENVGVALQAYLHRTVADLESLLPLRPTIRLVKGAYLESREVALARKREVDSAYHVLARRLLRERQAGRVATPSIATHDSRIIGDVSRMAAELELPKEAYEFAMLYGIGTTEQRHLLRQGYRLRVLISYGEAWFPWYMRRLAERPANVAFVLKQMVRL